MTAPASLIESLGQTGKFVHEFLRDPNVTGAVAPSSPFLARTVAEWIDWPNTNVLLEWGPGTGSFTAEILKHKPDDCCYLAMEINAEMADVFHRRFPDADICLESVANVEHVCKDECIEEVDCIVSGLPWAVFSDEMQTEFMEAMMKVLRRGGQFTTFAYIHGLVVPAGQRFRRKLNRYFSEVSRSRIVWPNIPPAFVYRCRR